MVCFVLSLLSVIVRAVGYLQLLAPRPLSRRLEVIAVGSPALVMLGIGLASAILE